jgi:hypothetical protein
LPFADVNPSALRPAGERGTVEVAAAGREGAERDTSDIDQLFYKQPSTLALTRHFSYAMVNIQE